MDPRLARTQPEPADGEADPRDGARLTSDNGGAEYRVDLERIRFSPYFSRLAAVTQVVSPGAARSGRPQPAHPLDQGHRGRPCHRDALQDGPERAPARRVSAAATRSWCRPRPPPTTSATRRSATSASRSSTGWPASGSGSRTASRATRRRSASSPSSTCTGRREGLNLTAAVRAAVLKYPWARFRLPDPHPSDPRRTPPRGGGQAVEGRGSAKFSAYLHRRRRDARGARGLPGDRPWQQTVECSVMDIADDIAYSLHDLDDFHRAGVLQHAAVAAEFRTWLRRRADFAGAAAGGSAAGDRRPGLRAGAAAPAAARPRRLDLRRRGFRGRGRPGRHRPGRRAARRAVRLLDRAPNAPSARSPTAGSPTCAGSVEVSADPPVRAGHVVLDRQGWHEVAVLKVVHQRFVLDRPDLAMFQRGQAQALTSLVGNLEAWLTDPMDAARAPRRLVDLVGWPPTATGGWRQDARSCSPARPAASGHRRDDIVRLGRGRGSSTTSPP